MKSIRPRFLNQTVLEKQGLYPISTSSSSSSSSSSVSSSSIDVSTNNYVGVVHDVLDKEACERYIQEAVKVQRAQGRSGFGIKPRYEVCYTTTGEPYIYGRVRHTTTTFPPHVTHIIPTLLDSFQTLLTTHSSNTNHHHHHHINEYTAHSTGVDIVYDASLALGEGKLRRSTEPLNLELEPNPDVVASVAASGHAKRTVAFAAEPGEGLEEAMRKAERKGVEAIAVNDISAPGTGFESETNRLVLLRRDGTKSESGLLSKLGCALWLLDQLAI